MTYDIKFTMDVPGRGTATCWRAEHQEYKDCMFSAGLVEGIPPDTIYMKIEGERYEPYIIFLRPDEALAWARVLMGALWSTSLIELHNGDLDAQPDHEEADA